MFNFLWNSQTVFPSCWPLYIPTSNVCTGKALRKGLCHLRQGISLGAVHYPSAELMILNTQCCTGTICEVICDNPSSVLHIKKQASSYFSHPSEGLLPYFMSLWANPPLPQGLTSNTLSLSHLTEQSLAIKDKLEPSSHPSLLESSAGDICFSETSLGILSSEPAGRWSLKRPQEANLAHSPLPHIWHLWHKHPRKRREQEIQGLWEKQWLLPSFLGAMGAALWWGAEWGLHWRLGVAKGSGGAEGMWLSVAV